MSSSSDNVTIDSSPHRKLFQNADTELAPGNLPAIPTIAIALDGSEFDEGSIPIVTLVVLPSAAWRLAGALRHAAGPDREVRLRARCCPGPGGRAGRRARVV